MIDLLEADGVLTDEDVASAMRSVDRSAFLPEEKRTFAYELEDVLIADHIIALNPRSIAEILSVARPAEGMNVLLLGTSTGYVEALLLEIGCRVHVIEPNGAQRAYAQRELERSGLADRVSFIGLADASRFDLVVSLKTIEKLDPRVLGFSPYGRTMLIVGEEHTLIALDYRGEPTEPDVSYSGSVWTPLFDPPLLDEQHDEPDDRA